MKKLQFHRVVVNVFQYIYELVAVVFRTRLDHDASKDSAKLKYHNIQQRSINFDMINQIIRRTVFFFFFLVEITSNFLVHGVSSPWL